MKSHLIRESFTVHSPEWHKARLERLNASEGSSVMGHNKYTPAAKLFCEKVGLMPVQTEGNIHTTFGLRMEDMIAQMWMETHPDDPESYVKNLGNPVRKCKKINASLCNPKYPWLWCSPDRIISKGQVNMITGELLSEECPLEIKTIDPMEASRWTVGIPTGYLIQVHIQMLVMEVEYSEIAVLSGKELKVIPVAFSKELGEQIIEATKDFWHNRVLPAKEIYKRYLECNDELEKGNILFEIQQYEPLPEPTPAYEDYLKERYRTSFVPNTIDGNNDDWLNTSKYMQLQKEAKRIKDDLQATKNLILAKVAPVHELTFLEGGKWTYYADKRGVRTLRPDKTLKGLFKVDECD